MLYSAAMSQEPPSGQPGDQPQAQPPQAQPPYAGQPQYPYPQQPAWQPPPPREKAGWGGTLGVTGVLLVVTLGGFLFGGGAGAGQLGGEVTLVETVQVTGGVTMQIPEGWSIAQPLENPPGIILTGPGGNALVGVPGSGPPLALIEFYVNEVLAPEANQLSVGDAQQIELASGEAWAAPYVGVFPDVAAPLEGEVIGIATPGGTGVVVDGWAPEGTYVTIREQVVAMAGSVSVG